MSLNMAIIQGRAGKDAEERSTKSGSAMCTASLATDFWRGKGDKTTEWHNIVAFGNQAEHLAKVKKGDYVVVVGRLSTREYENRSGNMVRSTEIIANRVEVILERNPEPHPSDGYGQIDAEPTLAAPAAKPVEPVDAQAVSEAAEKAEELDLPF